MRFNSISAFILAGILSGAVTYAEDDTAKFDAPETAGTQDHKLADKPEPKAEIVALPQLEAVNTPPQKKAPAADLVRAEIVPLPPLKKTSGSTGLPACETPPKKAALPVSQAGKPVLPALSHEPGHPVVLSGTLGGNLELGPADSPILVRGNLVIPSGVALKLKAGAVLQLQGDPKLEKPAQALVPDATEKAAVWVWGTLEIVGVTGNPVEITGLGKEESMLLLYGQAKSELEGLRLKNAAVAQNGGTCSWTNCELLNVRHYALAGGIGLFTHCTFRNCGGLFATYDAGPWSLLVRKSIFESCREGLILGSNPGEARLVIEKNHFLNTRGAHIRAIPLARALKESKNKNHELEFLIGENWYGSTLPEEVDLRIVDRRVDPSLKAILNTRPPAELPYKNVGAGVPASVLAETLREQQPLLDKLFAAQPQERVLGSLNR